MDQTEKPSNRINFWTGIIAAVVGILSVVGGVLYVGSEQISQLAAHQTAVNAALAAAEIDRAKLRDDFLKALDRMEAEVEREDDQTRSEIDRLRLRSDERFRTMQGFLMNDYANQLQDCRGRRLEDD